jgi:hypothetical protein
MHRALATTLDQKYVHLQIHVVVDVNCCNSVAIHDEDDLDIFLKLDLPRFAEDVRMRLAGLLIPYTHELYKLSMNLKIH